LPDWRKGLALTRQSVQKLNQQVLAAHIALGISAVAVSPFPSARTGQVNDSTQHRINAIGSVVKQSGALGEVITMSEHGLLPIVHGDIVLDDSQTCAVFGGDHIIAW
jgi:isopentenyl phosphate kinase